MDSDRLALAHLKVNSSMCTKEIKNKDVKNTLQPIQDREFVLHYHVGL